MVGTQQAMVEGRSVLAGVLGGNGALASAGQEAAGVFTEAMEEQLGGLLVELGIDPKQLEGMDVTAMLAQLQELLQGQLTAASGDALPLLGEAASQAPKSLAALKLFLQSNAQDHDQDDVGQDPQAQAALAALLQQWLTGADTGAQTLVGDEEAGHERVNLLLRQLFGAELSADGSTEDDVALLARLRQLLGVGQSTDGSTEDDVALLARLRQLLGVGQSTDGSTEDDVALLARLRQLLGVGQSTEGSTEDDVALLARLRQLLGVGHQPREGGADNQLPRPLFDFVAQALGERSGSADRSATLGINSSPTDGLALLKASLTTARGAESTASSNTTEGTKAFDLARLLTSDGTRQLADRIAIIARARGGVAELKLHPPSLGAMEVRVSLDIDKAHVHFVSTNPVVRDVLEAAMPRLREALAQDGLALGDASVSDQPPQPHDEAAGEGGHGAAHGGEAEDDSEALMALEGARPGSTLSALARRLDMFA
ncbi:flagellar hook-length control protein FliK [Rhabdochromatium marinum]|uniref:flagellar hook-length control protein FliK n=1 Tax=Rhabdochromatium marinum TaxID=48729 RepID=UPI001904C0B9|nr:flagellar hook-length control protein FliK [Rhabdochromatium marinum]MBK1648662.1 hypothetical protein [Rhabdochromatium marinum]